MNFAGTFLMAVALLAGSDAHAQMGPGPVGIDEGAACYNPITGEIIVSMNDVDTWYVESRSGSLTGATPIFPRPAVMTDNDNRIGQGDFGISEFTFTNHNLGPVAALGLPLSDFIVSWHPNLGGSPAVIAPVTLCVPEPTWLGLFGAGLGLLAMRRRCRDYR